MKHPDFKHSFRYAVEGILRTFKQERNFKVHLCIAALVLILGAVMHLSAVEFAALIVVIVMVLSAELLNTAVERTVDLICGDRVEPLAKAAKDAAAGAVLVTAAGAAVVGAIVFLGRIVRLIIIIAEAFH
jgi:diacylglycerol kinase